MRLSVVQKVSWAAGLWLAGALCSAWAAGGGDAKVFPVRAFFYDSTEKSALDPRFRSAVTKLGAPALAEQVQKSLVGAFRDMAGPLNKATAGRTFAVSFHVTRATSYSVDKGNGNVDLVVSVTASLYFTNVISGEILTTLSKTVVTRAVVAAQASQIELEKDALFKQALDLVLADLSADAGKNFSPTVVDVPVRDVVGSLLVLDAGLNKGVQSGDALNDSSGQLIEVVYAADTYSVAKRVLADVVSTGAVFQKFLSHASDGKIKPRTVVLVEALPDKFSKEYVGQLFSEMVGDKAPLSMVLVNPGFSQLMRVISQQASLDTGDTGRRKTPDLFIRLRVAEPLVFEANTNLEFKSLRHYETLAFADIVDVNGRVNFSALGKDVIEDSITRGIGPGVDERREVSIKNALLDLASQLSKLSETQRERMDVTAGSAPDDFRIATTGKSFFPQQKGMILRKLVDPKGKGAPLLIPRAEGLVNNDGNPGSVVLMSQLPLDSVNAKTSLGDVFEVQRFGVAPRSMQPFTLCGPIESLGSLKTPAFMELAAHALGSRMPGLLYAPSVSDSAKDLIVPATGFISAVPWKVPALTTCIQPVERINAADEQCKEHCDKALTARYTLRVKNGDTIVARPSFESQFKSSGFYKSTAPEQLKRLIDADVIHESQVLLDKVADKVSFQVN